MTKASLVDFIAESADLTKAEAARALDAVLEGIIDGLKKEEKIYNIRHFFTVCLQLLFYLLLSRYRFL